MELKQFVKSVLIDICEAVDEAKVAVIDKAAIAPGRFLGEIVDDGQLVSFELLVTVSKSAEGRGGGKIEVLALGVDVGGKVSTQREDSNKVQFQVPVYFSGRMDKESL